MEDKEIDLTKYSRSVQLGFKKIGKKFNVGGTSISFVMLAIMGVIISTSITKWTEINQESIKMLETKYVDKKVMIHDTLRLTDCDTVYIIDGIKFTKAGG
jgi:hypothetical protein